MRGTAFVHSALLARSQYVQDNLMHVTDWLPTLYEAAGGDTSHLGSIDGFGVWDMLSNQGGPIRKEVLHNIDPIGNFSALRIGDYKLVMGDISHGYYDSWYPPPRSFVSRDGSQSKHSFDRAINKDTGEHNFDIILKKEAISEDGSPKLNSKPILVHCGPKPANASVNCQAKKRPCLFHIPSDPCEFNNIANNNPYLVQTFLDRLEELKLSMVPPLNRPIDREGNPALHGGVWQWWK